MNSIRSMLQTANSRKKYSSANSIPERGTGAAAMPQAPNPYVCPGNPMPSAQYIHSSDPQQASHITPAMRTPPIIPAQLPTPVVKSGTIYRDLMKSHDRFTQRHL